MNYTKGKVAGGWIHVQDSNKTIALVHPAYVSKFIASPALYKALKALVDSLRDTPLFASDEVTDALQALNKAEGK